MVKAGIYARRSPRPTESETVARQLADARGLAESLGWEVVEEYVDNDISAYSMKRRPAYRRLLADIESGRLEAVAAAHTTRLYRHPKDLVEFVGLVQRTKIEVRTVTSGHYDLSTAAGRKHAYNAGIDGMYESDLLGERVTRERAFRAASGRPTPGGLRPFGYEADKVTLVPSEAELIRQAAERVAAGGSMYVEVKAWNDAGITTTAGNLWEVGNLSRILCSPRIAGLRSYKGQVVGPAVWPAIIDRNTHERILAMTVGRKRGQRQPSTWLLSALIVCPKCGGPLYGSTRSTYRAYVCAPKGSDGRSCGGVSVSADPCDEKVLGLVRGWLADPPKALTSWLAGGKPGLDVEAELVNIKDRRAELTRQYALDTISAEELDSALAVLAQRRADLEQATPTPRAPTNLREILAAWEDGSVEDRRAIIVGYVTVPMTLATGKAKDPADRLTVTPRWEG